MSRTSVALRIKEAMAQYSKKMCTRVTIFWMLYRMANFIVLLIRPELANAMVDLCAGVDTAMIVNMGAYLCNSSTEKIARAYVERKSVYIGSEKNGKSDDESDEDPCDEIGEE